MYISLMLCKQKGFKRSLSIFRIFCDSFLSVKTRKISAAHFSFLILFLSVRFAVSDAVSAFRALQQNDYQF